MDISSDEYWAVRLAAADGRGQLHHAVFQTSEESWKRMCERHAAVLRELIESDDAVLDVGCSYGSLLDVMPPSWNGHYCGVDISETLLERARLLHPKTHFQLLDMRIMPVKYVGVFDWAIARIVKGMFQGADPEGWGLVYTNMKMAAQNVLILESDSHEVLMQ